MTGALMRFIGCAYILHQSWLEFKHRPHKSKVSLKCEPDIIPRSELFGNPHVVGASLSPDGVYLAYMMPWEGVLNIFVLPVEESLKKGGLEAGKQLTFETKRAPAGFKWTYQPGVLIYSLDNDGDENWRIVKANVTDGKLESLTAPGPVRAGVYKLSHKYPDRAVISLNDEDPRWPNLYYVSLVDGSRSLCFNNSVGMSSMHLDSNLVVQFAKHVNDDASESYFLVGQDGELKPYYNVSFEEAAFTSIDFIYPMDESKAVWTVGYGLEYPKMVLKPLADPYAEGELVFKPEKSEISSSMWPRTKSRPIFVSEDPGRSVKTLLDDDFKKQFEFLDAEAERQSGTWHVLDYSDDLALWLVGIDYDNVGPAVYFFLPGTLKLELLYVSRAELAKYSLAKMHVYEVDIEDDLKMVCYLSIPRQHDVLGTGIPQTPLPMVLKVHGGPWSRTTYGFDRTAQWLANRGYAVLDCNFRTSTGLGRSLFRAGWGEWGRKMHRDLLDAVDWAAKVGVAQRDKVAIFGGSYGGYAALVGLTFTPDDFACGVDIVGPSNLVTLLDSIPPYWSSFYNTLIGYIGADPATEEGLQFLEARSPLNFVERIKKPLLIGQGANDPRVKIAESDQVVAAMKNRSIPVTYVVFPDEGHGFSRPQNREAFNYIMETFLQGCLGGRVEPAAADLLSNSTAQVRETGGLDLPRWTNSSAASQTQ